MRPVMLRRRGLSSAGIRASWRRALRSLAAAALVAQGCAERRVEPLQLEGNLLTALNQSGGDWTNVEIWINRQFRVTAPALASGQTFRAPLDHFVTGYGQRFNFSRMQIRDVRLLARGADGAPVEIRMEFAGSALADVLKGMGGQR